MKILIVGNWEWLQYEPSFAAALEKAGHEVIKFSVQPFFGGTLGRLQQALPVPAPRLFRLNKELLVFLRLTMPDIMLTWRSTQLLPSSIKKANGMGITTVSYNNDDPFGPMAHGNTPWHHRYLWTWYLKCLKHYSINMVYRPVNVSEAEAWGARNVHVLKPYFIPDIHHPVQLSEDEKLIFECDVVFAGHYEADGREEYLRALVDAGLHVRLFGGSYWTPKVLGSLAGYFGEIQLAEGNDYARALCGSRMCLAFLSKMNRDTYTRRCFEIPACGVLLLCERTEDLMRMFVDGEEAVFFSNAEELVEKALWLRLHPEQARQIAEAGMKRVWVDGHDVLSRAKEFMSIIKTVTKLKSGEMIRQGN